MKFWKWVVFIVDWELQFFIWEGNRLRVEWIIPTGNSLNLTVPSDLNIACKPTICWLKQFGRRPASSCLSNWFLVFLVWREWCYVMPNHLSPATVSRNPVSTVILPCPASTHHLWVRLFPAQGELKVLEVRLVSAIFRVCCKAWLQFQYSLFLLMLFSNPVQRFVRLYKLSFSPCYRAHAVY